MPLTLVKAEINIPSLMAGNSTVSPFGDFNYVASFAVVEAASGSHHFVPRFWVVPAGTGGILQQLEFLVITPALAAAIRCTPQLLTAGTGEVYARGEGWLADNPEYVDLLSLIGLAIEEHGSPQESPISVDAFELPRNLR